jgi:SAM-dependent methyltransferase
VSTMIWNDARRSFVSEMVGICLDVEPAVVGPFVELMADEWWGSRSPEALRSLGDELGLRDRWNDVFDNARAAFLADQVTQLAPPDRSPDVFDVLSGTGKVARELRRRGYAVAEYERDSHYGGACPPGARPLDQLADDAADRDGPAVVLLAAVLHHEPSPEDLLRLVFDAVPDAQVLVFENPLIGSWARAEHELFDWLFNRVINHFDVDTPGTYRTLSGWRELLGGFGRVSETKVLAHVPGLPFPYVAYLVERR